MKVLKEIAANYAIGKANEVIDKAIAQAYADGYRDGYKDREKEIPVNIRDNRTEYVDLGLPSGTLWSVDYEREDGDILYMPYIKSVQFSIPTEEQCKELFDCCKWTHTNGIVFCVGPNGNSISFAHSGYKEIDYNSITHYSYISYFWIQDENDEESDKKSVSIHESSGVWKGVSKTFSGYKLPIRLVRTK